MTTTHGLDAHVLVHRSTIDLDVAVTVAAGSTVAVVGPNGAGKTTLLRALAGLTALAPTAHVRVDGTDVTAQPPDRRPIGFAFQDALLLPGLTALDNVAYGLRYRLGRSRADARAEAAAWLERLEVGHRSGARAHELSGGEAQRVALVRALAPAPPLLLLDEPLAALDVGLRPRIRDVLREHLATSSAVRLLVTHDLADLRVLADEALVLDAGRVVHRGRPDELHRAPVTPFVRDLLG